jgi:hypothetical protein
MQALTALYDQRPAFTFPVSFAGIAPSGYESRILGHGYRGGINSKCLELNDLVVW